MIQEEQQQLTRIADALERLAPERAAADLMAAPAYIWSPAGIQAVPQLNALPLDRFAAIDAQRDALRKNSARHAEGRPAHDALLWGARGMGKSALVRAVAAASRLPLVEVTPDRVPMLGELFAMLAGTPRQFIVFVDDLGVDEDAGLRQLRSLLDGGVRPRPPNCRLYVTSNRRHLIRREAEANAAAAAHPRDALDDQLALAERFGISLGFHACSQDDYLAICRSLAAPLSLEVDEAEALLFARQRGARSGRIAAHFVTEIAGRQAR